MRECPVAEKFPVRFIGVLSGGRVSKQIIKNASLSNTFIKIYHDLCHLWRWCLSLFSVSEKVLFFDNFQSQYTASVAIQSLVPGGEQTKDPCVIIGNELISAPWECTIAVSTNGHKTTVARLSAWGSCTIGWTTLKDHGHWWVISRWILGQQSPRLAWHFDRRNKMHKYVLKDSPY